MQKTTVYVVGDDVEVVEQAKSALAALGVSVQTYGARQWQEGLESPYFRQQLVNGVPSLASGALPIESRSNILQFPTPAPATSADGRVATMDELESKAIENAILQYRGNLTEAAKALGIGRATLYRKVKQYQIDPAIARRKRAA